MNKTLQKIGVGAIIAVSAFAPVLGILSSAHAQVPDNATLSAQVSSTTDTGAGMLTATIFNSNLLRYLFYVSLIGVAIWLAYKALRHVI